MKKRFGRAVATPFVCLGFLSFLAWAPSRVQAQESKPPASTESVQKQVDDAWDSLVHDAIPQAHPDPVLTPVQIGENKSGKNDFLNHFFFESRTDYWRYSTGFTGAPTNAGVINAPITGIFNPNGVPYPPAFQGAANRIYSFIDWGTRGWISDRVNTHFALRYRQDLSHVDIGSPAENILETYRGGRLIDLDTASVEINGKPTDGIWAGTSLTLGRQYVYGSEIASLDGASFSIDRPRYSVTLFGGRRFTYYSDPAQRAIGGANVTFKLSRDTSIEYEGLWYVRGTNSFVFRKRFGPSWLVSSYIRLYGGNPVDFNAQGLYTPANGKTSVRVSFFQKLTNKDYFYDFTYFARDTDPYNRLQRLYLGPISQYSQIVVDARRTINPYVRLGATLWLRKLNDEFRDQGPFDTTFQDYRVHAQIYPVRKLETFFEYHQRNSERISPLDPLTFDDIRAAGETSVKDITAELRRSFGEGRMNVSGGAYYRRVSLQDRFYFLNGLHQSGFLAGAWVKLDGHSRAYFDYNLDNDFLILRPSLANSRVLRVGLSWKY